MQDRELLELSALAAGYELRHFDENGRAKVRFSGKTFPSLWNPLDDDADAFMLMCKLRLCVEIGDTLDANYQLTRKTSYF